MYLLSHMLYVWFFSILIELMNGYLLFAANLDDFSAIAKKLVPDTLGESLARMASKPHLRENLEQSDLQNTEEVSSEYDNNSLPPTKGRYVKELTIKGKEKEKSKETFQLNQGIKVNFDELVERIKKRLTKELKLAYLDNSRKEEIPKSLNYDEKQNNDKISIVHYKHNVGKHDARLNHKKNVKKQVITGERLRKVKDRYNFEEISPSVDTPREEIFNKPKAKQKIKDIKNLSENNDYDDAMTTHLEYSNLNHKGIKSVRPSEENRKPSMNEKLPEEVESTTDSTGFYEKLDFTQNDSYEDYATPARDEDYSSSEIKHKYTPNSKRYKIETGHQHFHKNFSNDHPTVKAKVVLNKSTDVLKTNLKSPQYNNDYDEKTGAPEEVKGVTANLWYDNDVTVGSKKSIIVSKSPKNLQQLWYQNNRMITENAEILSRTSKKPKFGTNLPTRHTFKMVTPNFIADVPLVVEKYNFDEPIPDRDREREPLKYIGNPPARVNRKIRLL